jgi:signal transduction histidine kinase
MRELLIRAADQLGAHRVPERTQEERDRALQRAVLGVCIASFWGVQFLAGKPAAASLWFVVYLGVAMPAASLVYRRFLESRPEGGIAVQYLFLLLDPVTVLGVLVQDPATFAFLSPFMLMVIVRNGIRFGARTMYLVWGWTFALSGLLYTTDFWRSEREMTFAYFLMLAFVPVFFGAMIRELHSARAVEEDRTRSAIIKEQTLARSSFLAKVSHELLSPLQGIVSALDVIEMRHAKAFDEDRELLGRMRRASMLLNAQLRDLLTLARGEAGRLEIHPESFEAGSLVEAMAEGARDAALAKGLQLLVDLPEGPVFVRADAARIDQMLTNLVGNSIRYTDSGHVRVSLRAQELPVPALQLVVADTGAGIPDELLPTLFAPDKSKSSPARRGEGSGIGLAIVRLLIDRLGGKLDVSSRLGEGTTFRLWIPVEPVAQAAAVEAVTPRRAAPLV